MADFIFFLISTGSYLRARQDEALCLRKIVSSVLSSNWSFASCLVCLVFGDTWYRYVGLFYRQFLDYLVGYLSRASRFYSGRKCTDRLKLVFIHIPRFL